MWRYDPKPDITAYELALIYGALVPNAMSGLSIDKQDIAGPPPERLGAAVRHFRKVEDAPHP